MPASQVALVLKDLPAVRRQKKHGFDPWIQKIPWRRKWQPTPVFLPGKPQRQRSLAGYSSWSCKELDTIESLNDTKQEKISVFASIINIKCYIRHMFKYAL